MIGHASINDALPSLILKVSMTDFVSPKELAHAIGASESSLKRWVDDGLLAVNRTAGGHRRIPIREAVQFIRTRKLKLVRPDILGFSLNLERDGEMLDDLEPAERLHRFLVEGKILQARALITSLFLQGMSIAQIADGPMRHALEEIGKIWRHDRQGILIEHRALEACIHSINVLFPLVEPENASSAMCAVGCSLPNDPYVLPNLMASAVLSECGFNTTNLGADLPISLLAFEARRLRPSLIWVSASVVIDVETMTRELDLLVHEMRAWNGMLAIGGRESHLLRVAKSESVSYCATMMEFVMIAEKITVVANIEKPVS
jgi:methanogenic corrinoid protein MtbC1